MAYVKSEMRVAAEQRMAGARARLDAVLASPTAVANGSAAMAEAMRANDHATAKVEVRRLAAVEPEVAEAWKALDEAAKFLAFSIMTDVT
ncbi:MAG: hypothetical protein JWO77_1616, partial [Ilumatobacteraceae bacterium]|nr:hypothetical protein [Ilumatobacteraceae bacterium]